MEWDYSAQKSLVETGRIRNAVLSDVPRLAEIIIFAKRTAYRPIFHDDFVSFNDMQVVGLAHELLKEGALENIVVYDDGIVKGMINRRKAKENEYPNGIEICEFFVDPFFQHSGIGSQMMQALLKESRTMRAENIVLWVLEKNRSARQFYEKFGFRHDGTRELEKGTEEYILRYCLNLQRSDGSDDLKGRGVL